MNFARQNLSTRTDASARSGVVAGIDIGGTTTLVVLCDVEHTVIERIGWRTPALDGGLAMLENASGLLETLLERSGVPLAGIGVGAAGVVDPAAGSIVVASDSFADWSGFPITRYLTERFGVQAALDNDANCFVRGEVSSGAVAGETDVLGITLGTGVGGAIWSNSSVLAGPRHAAGEIGHIPGFGSDPCTCGGRGHLETVAAGRSVTRRYALRTGQTLSPLEVAQRAEQGDLDAIATFDALADGLAQAVVLVANLLDIRTTVIGGGLAASAALWRGRLDAAIEADPPLTGRPLRIVMSSLGQDAVALGAASAAAAQLEGLNR